MPGGEIITRKITITSYEEGTRTIPGKKIIIKYDSQIPNKTQTGRTDIIITVGTPIGGREREVSPILPFIWKL